MKTVIFFLVLLIGFPLYAQETLIDGKVDIGGFGGPMVQSTSINGRFGLLVGGGGGVIIDHTIALGGAGYGLTNDVADDAAPASTPYLNLGYGGVLIQYIHRSDDLIHVTAGVLIGGGGLGFRKNIAEETGESHWRDDTLNDAIFVAEPNVGAELNVTQWFRIALGGSYRFVSGVELAGLDNADIGGPNGWIMFKFGSF